MAWNLTPVTGAGLDRARSLSTMRAEVRANVGEERTDLNSIIDQYLDSAQVELARAHRWRDLDVYDTSTMDTTADTATVALPSDVLEFYNVILEDGTSSYELTQLTPSRFREWYPYPEASSTGDPVHFAYIDETLYVAPIPSSAMDVHIFYKKAVLEMTDDSDEAEITHCEDYLVARATQRVFLRVGMFEDANIWRGEANALREDLIMEDERKARPVLDGAGKGFGAAMTGKLDHTSPWKTSTRA